MSFSTCRAVRLLEVTARDTLNLRLRAPRPHIFFYQQQRRLSTRPHPLRQQASTVGYAANDDLIPFASDAGRHDVSVNVTEKVAEGRVAQQQKDEVDEEWHAEISIASPRAREALAAAHEPRYASSQEDLEDASQEAVARDTTSGSSTTIADGISVQQLHHAGSLNESVATDNGAHTATTEGSFASRSESRLARKQRRIEAGRYKPQAVARGLDEAEEEQVQHVLKKIEGMEGPSGREKKTVKKQDKRDGTTAITGDDTETPKSPAVSKSSTPSAASPQIVKREQWQIQKHALTRKFDGQAWQPHKRVSPDTMSGMRALHASNPELYTTASLAEHFKISAEAVRRILKSKWQPSEEDVEARKDRWERRGVRKWGELAEKGVKPPAKWRAMGVPNPLLGRKEKKKNDDPYVAWG